MAAGWLEDGTPEARVLGEEIFRLLEVFNEEELLEIAEALRTGDWETYRW